MQGNSIRVDLVEYLKRPDADRSAFEVLVWEIVEDQYGQYEEPVLVEDYDPALLERPLGSPGGTVLYDGKTATLVLADRVDEAMYTPGEVCAGRFITYPR